MGAPSIVVDGLPVPPAERVISSGSPHGVGALYILASTSGIAQMPNKATAVTGMPHALPLISAAKAHPAGVKAARPYNYCEELPLHKSLTLALHHHGGDSVTVSWYCNEYSH